MSRHQHRASQRGDQSAPTTAHIEASPPPPIQEKTMEVSQEKSLPEALEVSGPTAKELAAAEEANQTRMLKIAEQQNAPPPAESVKVREVASRGYDALQEQFRIHNERSKPKEYVPPPRTANQMSRLQEELEAGARRVAAAEAQKAAAPANPVDLRKEGFTTPVFRPNDSVPDPVTGKLGAFGPDA